MNHTILRPLTSDPPLTDLQRAEELIKREMIVMLHHDCLETPTPMQMGDGKKKDRSIVNETQHRTYLEKHNYQKFTEDEMEAAKSLLEQEMEEVKSGMGHGDLSLES